MALDARLVGKPLTNDGSLPVMKYDFLKLPAISEGIWHAQMAGWPRILTYDHVSEAIMRRSQKRYANIDASGVVRSRESSADEYPFASTVENAGSTFISNVPGSEQHQQGGLIRAFYARHKDALLADKPFWFEVRVINGPLRR
jgi:hypothetical protein